ncbi:hypothetical protein L6164_003439 [Bauhinia variegata]|uniref:Uncharacterized protein n=1 Tax=Bauhinia variegata TaxID=167791 RepID=A0ACB9Q3C8_BAUVA|nr:hypothetical protein L6164_003439 [Bauhinia variegata]
MAEDHAVKLFGNKSELLLKYNPVHKKVPVLVHNDKPLAESLVILEYIDETWKSGYPILPAQPYHRALARFWSSFIDEKFLTDVPGVWKAAWSLEDQEREKGIEESHEALQILENELNKKKFFGGNEECLPPREPLVAFFRARFESPAAAK